MLNGNPSRHFSLSPPLQPRGHGPGLLRRHRRTLQPLNLFLLGFHSCPAAPEDMTQGYGGATGGTPSGAPSSEVAKEVRGGGLYCQVIVRQLVGCTEN